MMANTVSWKTVSGGVQNLSVTLVTHAEMRGSDVKKLIIALHGYGDNARNFVGLAHEIQSQDTLWLAPQGPRPIPHNFDGAQWYDLFGDPRAEIENSFQNVSQLILSAAKATGVTLQNTFLLGFSQGAFLSLYTALRLHEPLAGVIALSGYMGQSHRLPQLSSSLKEMPIFLAHGNQDQVVLPHMHFEAKDVLQSLGMTRVTARIYNNMGHSICPDEARHIEAFLKEHG